MGVYVCVDIRLCIGDVCLMIRLSVYRLWWCDAGGYVRMRTGGYVGFSYIQSVIRMVSG